MYRYYQRVSTRGQNLDSQQPEIDSHATCRANQGSKTKVYPADHYSGKTLNRPEWSKLYNDLRPGDTVVVWRLDRLGRTVKGLVNLLDDLQSRGIWFVSLRDGIDTTNGGSPTSRLLLNMLISIAAFETEVRAERIEAARAAKVARGETWQKGGRPVGSNHKLTAEVREQVTAMRGTGKSVSEISRVLNLARGTVYAALKT